MSADGQPVPAEETPRKARVRRSLAVIALLAGVGTAALPLAPEELRCTTSTTTVGPETTTVKTCAAPTIEAAPVLAGGAIFLLLLLRDVDKISFGGLTVERAVKAEARRTRNVVEDEFRLVRQELQAVAIANSQAVVNNFNDIGADRLNAAIKEALRQGLRDLQDRPEEELRELAAPFEGPHEGPADPETSL